MEAVQQGTRVMREIRAFDKRWGLPDLFLWCLLAALLPTCVNLKPVVVFDWWLVGLTVKPVVDSRSKPVSADRFRDPFCSLGCKFTETVPIWSWTDVGGARFEVCPEEHLCRSAEFVVRRASVTVDSVSSNGKIPPEYSCKKDPFAGNGTLDHQYDSTAE